MWQNIMIRTAAAIVLSSLLFAFLLGCLTQGNSSVDRYLTTTIPGWFGWYTTLAGFSGGQPQRILMVTISIGVQLFAFVPALVAFILLSRGVAQPPRFSPLRGVAFACATYAVLQFGFFLVQLSWKSPLVVSLYNSLHLQYRFGPPSILFRLTAASCLAVVKFPYLWSGLAVFCYLSRRFPCPYPVCSTCHYNLTGNTSGVCPECGMKLRHS